MEAPADADTAGQDTEESPTQATVGALLTMSAGKVRSTRARESLEDGQRDGVSRRLDVDAEGDEHMASEDDQYSASVPEGPPGDGLDVESADTAVICRRRVPVSHLNEDTPLYAALRQWLVHDVGGSIWAPPRSSAEGEAAQEQPALPPPKDHNKHTLSRLKPMRRQVTTAEITRRPATGGVGRQQLLSQHVAYAKKIRSWHLALWGHRVLRYRERLAAVVPYGEAPEGQAPAPESDSPASSESDASLSPPAEPAASRPEDAPTGAAQPQSSF
eukprot:tig00000718_g3745.t1